MSSPEFSVRERLGCWAHERWRLEVALAFPRLASKLGIGWMDLRNRRERIRRDAASGGRICSWNDSSALTVTRVFPRVARRLLNRCLAEWPIDFASEPPASLSDTPDVTIVIGVRGTRRLPQLMACLASARAQRGVAVEIVLVEQSWQAEFATLDLPGVRYRHQQCTSADMPYNRSWALNAGARLARGRYLLLHDADMLLPARAAESIVTVLDAGLDGMRLPRLLFYLDRQTSESFQADGSLPPSATMERVIANNRTPIAVRKDAYFAIGGHDESYYGWGAEDDDFMDRLRSRPISEGAPMPVLHLWHASAAAGPSRQRNAGLLVAAREQPIAERISRLTSRDSGQTRPGILWHQTEDITA